MKKPYIIAAAVILLLVLVIVFLMIFGGSKKITPDDPTCKYEYYCKKDGKSISVTVEGEFPEGYEWKIDDTENGAAEAKAVSVNKNKASFSVTPVKEGRYSLFLVLKKDGIPEDRIYEIQLNFTVDASANIEFSSSSHKELDPLQTYTQDGYEYVIAFGSENTLNICIRNRKTESFSLYVDNRIVTTEAVSYTDEAVKDAVFVITPVNVGECAVYIIENESNKALRLELDIDEYCKISVKSNTVIDYDYKKVIEDEDFASAEETVGKITIPEGYERTGCNIKGYENSKGERFIGIDIEISGSDGVFDYVIFPETESNAVCAFYGTDSSTKTDVTLLGLDAVCYVSEYYTTVVWSEGKNVFAVTSASTDAENAAAIAEQFVGAVGAK